jgi:hypothetical protein
VEFEMKSLPLSLSLLSCRIRESEDGEEEMKGGIN